MEIDTKKLDRLTIIDKDGRVYEKEGINVTLFLQDNGHTLKVFVTKGGKK